jgi:two-component system sensor histidine kinase UhpB
MKETDKFWRSVMAAATDAVLVTTPCGTIVSSNEATAKRFDHLPEDLIGTNVFDHSPPAAADLQRSALRDAVKTKHAAQVEYRCGDKYFQDTVYPVCLENGDVNEMLVFSTEITCRKQVALSLRKSKDYYKSILKQQTELVARFNPDFTLTFVNEAYCRYFAKPENELLGRSFFTLIPEEDWGPVRQHFTLFTPDNSVHVHQHLVVAPDGSRRWQQWTNRAFFDDSGKLREYQSGGIDITERKLAEEKTQALLNQNRNLTQRLFKAQEEERRHLARELHDEFGQWLTAIQLNIQNLTHIVGKQSADIEASIAAITNSTACIQKDIHGMIRSLRPALLDELGLEDSLRELVAQWQEHNPTTECTLELKGDLDNLGETLNITVYRLVQEGLTNTAKHAQASQAAVRLCRQQMCRQQRDAENEDCITLTIQDNGKGIDSHPPTNGYGLAGMRERVLAVGGNFSIDDSHEQGVRLDAQLFISPR